MGVSGVKMFLLWVVSGTNVIYHRSSTMERVPAVVVGLSKLYGNFLSIQQPSRSIQEITATIQTTPQNDSNHPEGSRR